MTDIHDIKPLESPGVSPMPFLYVLASLSLIALLAVLFIVWNRRRNRQAGDEAVIVPPEEIAFAALDDLAGARLTDRVFYYRLSAILRGYMAGRHGINALEMTSEQLIPQIEHMAIDREHQQALRDLIRSTDPIKFAGFPATEEKTGSDLGFVRQYVQLTTPARDAAEDT